MKKKQKHQRYDTDFKRNAALLANHPEIRTKDVAEVLQIHPFMLSRWKKEFREGRMAGKTTDNAAAAKLDEAKRRISELEKELARVRVENDLLKKAKRFLSSQRRSPTNSSKGTAKRSR
jgi:transposase